MLPISIEGGCVHLEEDLWVYRWNDNAGLHEYIFEAGPNTPRVGDSIVNGYLVPLVGWKINTDTSKWQETSYDTWPE